MDFFFLLILGFGLYSFLSGASKASRKASAGSQDGTVDAMTHLYRYPDNIGYGEDETDYGLSGQERQKATFLPNTSTLSGRLKLAQKRAQSARGEAADSGQDDPRKRLEERPVSDYQKPLAQDMNAQRRRALSSDRHKSKFSGTLIFIVIVVTLLTLMSISQI